MQGEYKISVPQMIVLTHSGLRGAVALILALVVDGGVPLYFFCFRVCLADAIAIMVLVLFSSSLVVVLLLSFPCNGCCGATPPERKLPQLFTLS